MKEQLERFLQFCLIILLTMWYAALYWDSKNILNCIRIINALRKTNLYDKKIFFYLSQNQTHIEQLRDGVLILYQEKILNEKNLRTICMVSSNARNKALNIQLRFHVDMLGSLQNNAEPTFFNSIKSLFSRTCRLAKKRDHSISVNYDFIKEMTDRYLENLVLTDGNEHKETCSKSCVVCGMADEDSAIKLGCGHYHHIECYTNGVKSYLNQEMADKVSACFSDGCNYKLAPKELADIIMDPPTIVAIQKLLIRSIQGVLFCPSCSHGVTKENKYLGFAYTCSGCNKDSCFSCGNKPHHGMTCSQVKEYDHEIKFLKEVVRKGESTSYGKCPHCKVTVGKHSGCNAMICGRDTESKGISSYKGKGCGKSFNWNNRIRIEEWLKNFSGKPLESRADSSTPRARNVFF